MDHEHSSIERLLHELSWEGRATHYRQGGRGLENVLTVEVFQALDFLPRTAFLGAVLGRAHGAYAAVESLIAEVEEARLSLLPGDIFLEPLDEMGRAKIHAQPDALIVSSGVYCMVEAKRFDQSAFQPEQLAKELALTVQEAGDRLPLMLLVLPEAPPVPIKSHGRMAVEEAIALGSDAIRQRFGVELDPTDMPRLADVVAVVTWDEIALALDDAVAGAEVVDPSVRASLDRVASSALAAIRWHASKDEDTA